MGLRLMTNDIRASAALGLALLLPSTAIAQGAPPQDVSGWTVAPSEDGGGCFLTRVYDRPGATTVMLGLDRDGTNRLTVLNANWSIEPKEKLKLTFRLSNGGYANHFAVGIRSGTQQGFVTSFEAKFPGYFASSRTLHIARGKVPVERLDLDGSGAAVAELRRCVAAQRDDGRAARRPRGDDIPRDPFAEKRK